MEDQKIPMKYAQDPNLPDKHCNYCGKEIIYPHRYLFCDIGCERGAQQKTKGDEK